MEAELETLELRLRQLLQAVQALRAENLSLRQQLAAAHDLERQQDAKMGLVRQRLGALAERLPADDQP